MANDYTSMMQPVIQRTNWLVDHALDKQWSVADWENRKKIAMEDGDWAELAALCMAQWVCEL